MSNFILIYKTQHSHYVLYFKTHQIIITLHSVSFI